MSADHGTGRLGAVILARHGKPALSRKVLLSSQDYQAWWARYEAGSLRPDQSVPPSLLAMALDAGAVVASTRTRSVETARAVMGARDFVSDAVFVEAPLPPPRLPRWIRLPPIVWGFISRVTWWFFDLHLGEESRREAEARAEAAASRLIGMASEGKDVLVLAHGFFNTMIARVLRRRGWRCTVDEGYRYWSARRFEKRI
ncbi:MAG TPA: histidine phosphatase family protein [Caulobacteraceae bacterium]